MRPIRPWRLAAGVALHLAVPLFLVVLGIVLLPKLGEGASRDQLAAVAVETSLRFLGYYLIAAAGLTLVVRALEPVLRLVRRPALEPGSAGAAAASQRQLDDALRRVRQWRGAPAAQHAEARLAGLQWHHDDPRVQAITSDLERVTAAFDRSVGQGELDTVAAEVLDRLAAAAERVDHERRRLDEGDARTLARYIELRYPSSDLTGA